jgi:rare lipoprotein A
MRYAIKNLGAVASLALLVSCGGFNGNKDGGGLETASTIAPVQDGVSDEPIKVGSPFTVGSVTYTPQDVQAYDEVGYASYYGAELNGRPTANGEVFLPQGATAAHKTLAMPTYVEVTALDTGRTILVRVNDRGPFANDRLIDLSEGAARQLGITSQGVSGVRVRKVNPPEQERAVLRQGMTAAERIDTPEPLLKVLRDKLAKQPKPSAVARGSIPVPVRTMPGRASPSRTDPVGSSDGRFIREGGNAPRTATPPPKSPRVAISEGDYVVQVAAFSSRSRADALALKLGASVAPSADANIFRVRYGPYATQAEAERSLASARQRGYPQAKLYRD